jgi:hypothetical protein
LHRIDGKMDQIVRNTNPPPEPADEDRKHVSPLLVALIVGAAVVTGFVVYFAAQKG